MPVDMAESAARTGVPENKLPLRNELQTFADMLQQGCDDTTGNPNYVCYHTAQIGKWHLASKTTTGHAPWQRGFDRVFGFKKGRRYWDTSRAMQTHGMQTRCQHGGGQDTIDCVSNADCCNGADFCLESRCTTALTKFGDPAASKNFCVPWDREACVAAVGCDPNSLHCCTESSRLCDRTIQKDCTATHPNGDFADEGCCQISPLPGQPVDLKEGRCRPVFAYVGPSLTQNSCSARESRDPNCTQVSSNGEIGKFRYRSKLRPDGSKVDYRADGSSRSPKYPCNDAGRTSETGCAYSTRVLRDEADDFIRSVAGDPDRPFFAFLAFHAAHNAFQGTSRARAHYGTIEKTPPKEPAGGAERYFAIVEEVDAAVGTLLKTLDLPGVCAHNAYRSCAADIDCKTDTCVDTDDDEVADACDSNPYKACTTDADCSLVDPICCDSGMICGNSATWQCENGESKCCSTNSRVACAADSDCDAAVCELFGRCAETGEPCSDQVSCPACTGGAGCQGQPQECVSLADRTLVMFTNDHGGPSSSYGAPFLRGNKQNLFEGGVRVGLLARGTTLGVSGGHVLGNGHYEPVGSQVDVMATIAEAAGVPMTVAGPNGEPPGRISDSAWNVNKFPHQVEVDSQSLLGVLANDLDDDSRRDFVFASYQGDAIISRPGYYEDLCEAFPGSGCGFAAGVCAYEAVSATPSGGGRSVRGASCTPCDPDATNDPCADEACEIAQSVCVDQGSLLPGQWEACRDRGRVEGPPSDENASDQCPVQTFRRCRNIDDCVDAEKCVEVWVKCNTCIPASWKVHGANLYDVVSNTEEDIRKFEGESAANLDVYGADGRLNCYGESDSDTTGFNAKLEAVREDLECRLERWRSCLGDVGADGSKDCDYLTGGEFDTNTGACLSASP